MKSAFHKLIRKLKTISGLSPGGSLPASQKERTGTKLADVQRRIGIYLHALWDRDFVINQASADAGKRVGNRPSVEHDTIHLPGAYDDIAPDGGTPVTGLEIYRAAAAHASAHIIYSKMHFTSESLDAWQKALISAVEDARVEKLAFGRFPGLKDLWARQHTATPLQNKTAGDYLNRLARALLDQNYVDDDPWIRQGRELFSAIDYLEDHSLSRNIGVTLAHAFQEKKIRFNVRTDMQSAPYRDDNRHLWEPKPDATKGQIAPSTFFESKYLSLWEFARFGSGEKKKSPFTFYDEKYLFAEDQETDTAKDAGESSGPETDEDAEKLSAMISKEPEIGRAAPESFVYSEWNFRSQNETESWVTVREMSNEAGDLQVIDDIIARNNHLLARMKVLLNAIRYGGVHRIRKLEEGDELDINSAIRAQIDIRLGVQPDPRVMMRTVRKTRDISVLLLLDLSRSTNEKVQGQEHTVLELTQQVCVLFAEAIKTVGDPFAIHGFCSETRHNVEYYRLKDFDQPYDNVPKARIAGMTGQRGTRMGAAIRHATYYLNMQKSRKKLLILITDGKPDDVDVRGEEYLLSDTKKSVEGASRCGINTYCISLDHSADRYVSRIFGARNYMVVDHVRSLPEKMLLLYAALTR